MSYKHEVIFVVLAACWLFVAVVAALLVGGAISVADRRASAAEQFVGLPADLTVDDVLGLRRPTPSS